MALVWLGRFQNEQFILDTSRRRLLRVETSMEKTSTEEENSIPLKPYDAVIVDSLVVDPDGDPARPELCQSPRLSLEARKISKRQIHRSLASLCAPEDLPPLWTTGPSTSYAMLTGEFPSVSIVKLSKKQVLFVNRRDEKVHLGFPWLSGFYSFPLASQEMVRIKPQDNYQIVGRKGVAQALGHRSRYALLAYATPVEGYCVKLIVSVLA